MVLDATSLNTQQYKVKCSNPGKGAAPSLTPWYCSYWKISLLVNLDNDRQLYFLRLIDKIKYFLYKVEFALYI